jgi:hypothetical protein
MTLWKLLHSSGVLLKPIGDKEPVVRAWIAKQPAIDEWTAAALRRKGFGHLLD